MICSCCRLPIIGRCCSFPFWPSRNLRLRRFIYSRLFVNSGLFKLGNMECLAVLRGMYSWYLVLLSLYSVLSTLYPAHFILYAVLWHYMRCFLVSMNNRYTELHYVTPIFPNFLRGLFKNIILKWSFLQGNRISQSRMQTPKHLK